MNDQKPLFLFLFLSGLLLFIQKKYAVNYKMDQIPQIKKTTLQRDSNRILKKWQQD